MKYVLLISSLFIFGCTVKTIEHDRYLYVSGFDFRKYAEEGFLFTPLEPQGEYESLGIITISLLPSVKKRPNEFKTEEQFNYHTVEESNSTTKYWIEKLNAEQAIDSAYSVAKRMGANALTSLKIKNGERSILNPQWPQAAPLEITGFAIRMK